MALPSSQRFTIICMLLLTACFWWFLSGHPSMAPFYQRVENSEMDLRFNLRGEYSSGARIVYLNIDPRTLSYIGERPFPRQYYALAMEAVVKHGQARAVALDVVFSTAAHSALVDPERVRQDNQGFRRVLFSTPRLLLAAAYTPRKQELTLAAENARELIPFPYLYKGARDRMQNDMPERPNALIVGPRGGFQDLALINYSEELSGDAVPRIIPVFAQVPVRDYFTMGLEMIRIGAGLPLSAYQYDAERLQLRNADGSLLVDMPLEREQLVRLNWGHGWGPRDNIEHISLIEALAFREALLRGTPEEQARAKQFFQRFNDAYVLIGPTDPLLQDIGPNPFDASPQPKVLVHGNFLEMALSQRYLTVLPDWALPFLLFALTGVSGGLAAVAGRFRRYARFAALTVIFAYIGFALTLFVYWEVVLPLLAPAGSALSAFACVAVYRLFHEEKLKSRIKGMFSTYLSPTLVNRMIESGEEPGLGGVDATITAVFTDVEGFSVFSEKLEPTQLVELMNEYLTAMTDILMEEGAFVDKYIGDAIVAMFNAPVAMEAHEQRACIAAARMQLRQAELRKKWQLEAHWPEVVASMETRIGINTGHATVGNMGSQSRFNYTMMGDAVNLAARCESGAKAYGVKVMVTDDTFRAATAASDALVFRYLDRVRVKGREAPVALYELVGLREGLEQPTLSAIERYEAALQLYFSQQFEAAQGQFEAGIEDSAALCSTPSVVMAKRCRELLEIPPGANWDGVFSMTHK